MQKLRIGKELYSFYQKELNNLLENKCEITAKGLILERWKNNYYYDLNEELNGLNVMQIMFLLTEQFEVVETKEEKLAKEFEKLLKDFYTEKDIKKESHIAGRIEGIKKLYGI